MADGVFDDVPAENFGALSPLPDGYVVVWSESSEMYFWTIRGGDIEGGVSWDRYWVRRCALAHWMAEQDENQNRL